MVASFDVEMIAIMGETTGYQAMKYMKSQMENSPEGSKILRYRVASLSNPNSTDQP